MKEATLEELEADVLRRLYELKDRGKSIRLRQIHARHPNPCHISMTNTSNIHLCLKKLVKKGYARHVLEQPPYELQITEEGIEVHEKNIKNTKPAE